MTGVLNEEAFGLGNRESQYENEVWAQSRGTENDGRYCGFPTVLEPGEGCKTFSSKIYIYERERGLLPGRQRKQHFSIGEYDTFFMDLPFHIIGQNTCYAGLSIL